MKKLFLSFLISAAFGYVANAQNCQAMYVMDDSNCPEVMFYDTSWAGGPTAQIIYWSYDFGDGNSSTSPNSSNTYVSNGTYLTCLTIATSDGCVSTHCDSVVIDCIQQGPNCEAMFYYQGDSAGCNYYFYDYSSAITGVVEWDWSFGDGTTSADQNPVHTYSGNGWYNVCLSITAADSCTSTYCDSVYVDCSQQGSNCESMFYYQSDSSCNYYFYDYSSATTGVVEWDWSFGDGTTSTDQNPMHTYTNSGWYSVCLSITAADSCTSTYCDSIYVNCSQQGSNCEAMFYYQGDSANCDYYFNDYSSATFGVVEWEWSFGDGTTSSDQNPVHTYSGQGWYNVCLTITAADSCVATYCNSVYVDCLAGLSEESFSEYTISPNPAANELNINFSESIEAVYQIIGLNGAIYKTGELSNHKNRIDVSDLTSGFYILQLENNGKYAVSKFVKK